MSHMSTLATAGIPVEEMAAYLAEHPGVGFDEAVRVIEKRHTGNRRKSERPANAPVWTVEQRLQLDNERNGPRLPEKGEEKK